jgi:hypothetical protein
MLSSSAAKMVLTKASLEVMDVNHAKEEIITPKKETIVKSKFKIKTLEPFKAFTSYQQLAAI